jgi:uncharacterized protein (DUF1330 family)
MPAFQPTANQFRAFRDHDHDGPVAQVNLLKFRVKAIYQPTDPEYMDGSTGEEAYLRYADAFEQMAKDVDGACVFKGKAERFFIGDGDWDMVWINQFPDRKAFIETLNHNGYKQAARHRDAGLHHQDLIVTHPRSDD